MRNQTLCIAPYLHMEIVLKLIELREYEIKEGKTKEWLKLMQEEILPYQKSKGMKIMSTYLHKGADGTDYFIWLREFDDESSRQEIYASTYNDWWINEVRPRVFQLIKEESIKVRIIEPVQL